MNSYLWPETRLEIWLSLFSKSHAHQVCWVVLWVNKIVFYPTKYDISSSEPWSDHSVWRENTIMTNIISDHIKRDFICPFRLTYCSDNNFHNSQFMLEEKRIKLFCRSMILLHIVRQIYHHETWPELRVCVFHAFSNQSICLPLI